MFSDNRRLIVEQYLRTSTLLESIVSEEYLLLFFDEVIDTCNTIEQLYYFICAMADWFVSAIEKYEAGLEEPSPYLCQSFTGFAMLEATLDSSCLFDGNYRLLNSVSKEKLKNGLVDILIAKKVLSDQLCVNQPQVTKESLPPQSPPRVVEPWKEQIKNLNDQGSNTCIVLQFLADDVRNSPGVSLQLYAKLKTQCGDMSLLNGSVATLVTTLYENWLVSIQKENHVNREVLMSYSREQFKLAVEITSIDKAKEYIDTRRQQRMKMLRNGMSQFHLLEHIPNIHLTNSVKDCLDLYNQSCMKSQAKFFNSLIQPKRCDATECEKLLFAIPKDYRSYVYKLELDQLECDEMIVQIDYILDHPDLDIDITFGDIQLAILNQVKYNLSAMEYLHQNCEICTMSFPVHRIRSRTNKACECSICHECYDNFLSKMIEEKPARQWRCPSCSVPKTIIEDDLKLLNLFDDWRKRVSQWERFRMKDKAELIRTFKWKVEQYHLKKRSGAFECPKCTLVELFKYPQKTPKVKCGKCQEFYCRDCSITWIAKHDEFGANAEGCQKMQQYLAHESLPDDMFKNLIECPNPKCKEKVEKVLGACEDFICRKCRWNYCPCGVVFYTPANPCPHCPQNILGLHAHHSRDCYTFIRDWDVPKLKAVLQENKVPFQKPATSATCVMRVQLEEKTCGAPVVEMDYCEKHIKWYLGGLICSSKTDPINRMTLNEIEHVYRNGLLPIPPKLQQSNEDYLKLIKETLVANWPLGQLAPNK